jgi:hypothetical protein
MDPCLSGTNRSNLGARVVAVTPRRRVLVAPALLAVLLVGGCSKTGPASSSGAPGSSAPAGTTPTASSPQPTSPGATTPGATGSAGGTTAENQDLAQAQQDITDLENELNQVDAGLNVNPATEGDVSP